MPLSISPNTLVAKAISRGKTPAKAGQFPVPLQFQNAPDGIVTCAVNIQTGVRNNHGIDGLQSIYIDNSNNAQTVSIAFDSGQVIVSPSYSQAIYPVFFSGNQLNFVATSTGGVQVNLIFLNTREQAQLWSTKIPIGGSVNVTGSTIYSQPKNGSFTDASAALAAGGTAQLLLAANGARQLLAIRNPATAASQGIAVPEPVYLGFTTAAPTIGGQGTWELLPGESLPEFLLQSTEAIYWNAATTAHRLTAKYM